ncbi:MAG TPA: DinB family protein [Trueperaceae bacterium]|nr:DinB family protein [Trueperaceae bacterium]
MNAYLQRILDTLGEHDPIDVLRVTPQRLATLLEGMGPGDLERSYAPDKWDARHVFAHLADVELAMGFRLRLVLGQPGVELPAFDQDVWAQRYERLDPALAVEAFRGLRAWNLSLLATLGLDDWLAEGYHPERGFESVDVMVRFLAGHDINHLAQLESILAL